VLPPDLLLEPVTLAGERTVVVAEPLLFSEFPSGVPEVTVAVLLIVEPAGTVGATATVSVKTELPSTDNEGFEHETEPPSPGSGAVHDQPAGALRLTKVVPAGSVSFHEVLTAESGPLLVTVMV